MYSLADVPAGRVRDLYRLPYLTSVFIVGCGSLCVGVWVSVCVVVVVGRDRGVVRLV